MARVGVRAGLGLESGLRSGLLTYSIVDQKGRAFLVEMNTNGFMPGDDVLYKMQKVSNSVSQY